MKNVKHKKYKNTGLIYEMLIRKLTSEVISGGGVDSINILKEYFSDGRELQKELSIYRALYKQKYEDRLDANNLLNALREARSQLDEDQLKKEKYNLVKYIKETVGFNNLFSIDIPDYKVHASIYNLLEYKDQDDPVYLSRCKSNVLEHINSISEESIYEKDIYKDDPNLLNTTYKLFLEKFNKKYSKFTSSQKRIIREYISNPDNSVDFKNLLEEECSFIKDKLDKFRQYNSDDALNVKLGFISDWLSSVQDIKFIKEEHITTILKYQDLLKELNIKDERFTK